MVTDLNGFVFGARHRKLANEEEEKHCQEDESADDNVHDVRQPPVDLSDCDFGRYRQIQDWRRRQQIR
jgi:hypothetical protein